MSLEKVGNCAPHTPGPHRGFVWRSERRFPAEERFPDGMRFSGSRSDQDAGRFMHEPGDGKSLGASLLGP